MNTPDTHGLDALFDDAVFEEISTPAVTRDDPLPVGEIIDRARDMGHIADVFQRAGYPRIDPAGVAPAWQAWSRARGWDWMPPQTVADDVIIAAIFAAMMR